MGISHSIYLADEYSRSSFLGLVMDNKTKNSRQDFRASPMEEDHIIFGLIICYLHESKIGRFSRCHTVIFTGT